jgi:uroporphyrinogen decarboxylase
MTSRERIIAYVEGKKTDRVPFVIRWGPWDDTHRRWKAEGMKNDDDWYNLFSFDPLHVSTDINFCICPPFKREILGDEGDKIVFRDEHGVIKRDSRGHTTMPQFLEYPVKDRKTWEEHKWRFDPDSPERFPPDWDERAKRLKDSEILVAVATYPYGFFGGVRTMMGAEAALIGCALDPELIDDINGHLCNLWHKLWSRVFEETRVDEIAMWEDMAGKQGSLISPKMFRRFLTPYYKKLSDLGRKHGVKIVSVDSDGYMHELTELFLEAGVNVLYPYEVQAGNDIPYLLNKYPHLCAIGGMDKRAMARDKAAIDAEIERVKSIIPLGRYVPFPDHLIPADVSWENYQYFVWRWKEITGKAGSS